MRHMHGLFSNRRPLTGCWARRKDFALAEDSVQSRLLACPGGKDATARNPLPTNQGNFERRLPRLELPLPEGMTSHGASFGLSLEYEHRECRSEHHQRRQPDDKSPEGGARLALH